LAYSRRIMRYFLLLTVLTVGLMTGHAEAWAYTAGGNGTASCGAWSAHRRQYNPGGQVTRDSQAGLQETAWIIGFLSGIGFVGPQGADPLDGVDIDGVLAWVDNYCHGHPIENVAAAAAAFYYAHPRR
jgi:hypothetical protein